MEKLHRQFVDGCMRQPGMTEEIAEELFRQVAAFAQLRVRQVARRGVRPDRLRVVVPQAVLPGPVPRRADQRPADGLLPGRGPRQRREAPRRGGAAGGHQRARRYKTTTEWVGRPGRAAARRRRDRGHGPSRSARRRCVIPSAEARDRWTPEVTAGWGVRLGLHLVKGIGEQHEALLDAELARGPYRAWPMSWSGPGCPRRSWSGSSGAGRWTRWAGRGGSCSGSCARSPARHAAAWMAGRPGAGRAASAVRRGRPMDLRLPATDAPALPPLTESERIGDAYAVLGLDARRQVVGLFRPALDRLGAVTERGPRRIGGRAGPDRRAGRHPPAPDDGQGHGLPGPRGRDRDGQRHPLAGRPGRGCGAWSGGTRCCWSTATSSARARWST